MCLLGMMIAEVDSRFRGNDLLMWAENGGAEADEVSAFLDGDPVGVAHAHGKVFYIYSGFYFIEKFFGFPEIMPVVLGAFQKRPHGHEACYFYIFKPKQIFYKVSQVYGEDA